MIWQTIFAPKCWKKMSILVFLACLNVRTQTYNGCPSMPSPPWQNSVGSHIILYWARTDDPADDFRSKMMETNILACLVDLLRSKVSDVSQLSIDAIAALAKFGRLTSHFLLCKS